MDCEPEVDSAWRRGFVRRLRGWYGKNGRDLPWRRTRDPYRIWVSEVMLQQTTVAAVIPYYERFIARLPTVGALARASESTVLRLWEGLGYYSRARNLHAAAKAIYGAGGGFPESTEELRKLPGIGRYTAGAIASFAFDAQAPILEANTLRLYSRLIGYSGDPKTTAGQRRLWSFAERIVPRRHAGAFNHALMDLGATICLPNDPDCQQCPVRIHCAARAADRQREIPRMPGRAVITDVTEGYVVVARGTRLLLRRRRQGERWAGLWDFPRCELPSDGASTVVRRTMRNVLPRVPFDESLGMLDSASLARALEVELSRQANVSATILEPFAEIRHSVTRYRMRVLCFGARYLSGDAPSEARWLEISDLVNYPLSRSGRKLANLLAGH